VAKQINPSKATEIIDETDIILFTAEGINGRSPYIREHKLKRSSRHSTRPRIAQLMGLCSETRITNRL
jgi:hypothetical protein